MPDSLKPIIDKAIDGEGSTPIHINASRPGTFGARSLTRRIEREILLAPAPTLGADHKGVERPRVWLGAISCCATTTPRTAPPSRLIFAPERGKVAYTVPGMAAFVARYGDDPDV